MLDYVYFNIFWYLVAKLDVDTAENEFRVNPNRVRVLRVMLRVLSNTHWKITRMAR